MKSDIIIPVWNQLELTKDCIKSIIKNTPYPYGLIIVDNGSNIETKKYLESLEENGNSDLILIRNERNLGFVKAANQGMEHSSAPYVCLLNNDTEVAEGWLTEMVKVAEMRDDIGIVNPNSNTLGYRVKNGQTVEEVASELKSYSGVYSELAWASGFCMLIKRKVIQEVGLFDEIYGMGMFEDADFCKRAQAQGYLSVCAKAAYVYHRERRSFIKFKKFDQDFKRNRQIFFTRWGRQERILYVLMNDNPQYKEKTGEEALKLARQGNVVWVFLKNGVITNFQHHSNIYLYTLPARFFNLVSFWKIIKRKKKFDKIYVDDADYAKRLNSFRFFHQAEVIYAR